MPMDALKVASVSARPTLLENDLIVLFPLLMNSDEVLTLDDPGVDDFLRGEYACDWISRTLSIPQEARAWSPAESRKSQACLPMKVLKKERARFQQAGKRALVVNDG